MKFKINWQDIRFDKRAGVYGICLLIATFFWFLNALSKEYTTTVMYPIRYKSIPSDKLLINEPPNELKLRVRAYGFSLLRHNLNMSFSPIVLNIEEVAVYKSRYSNQNRLQLATISLFDNISKQINSEVQLMEIKPDSIQFLFDEVIKKQVAVLPNVAVSVKQQFIQKERAYARPEMIELKGPKMMLDTIDTVYTIHQEYENVETTIKRNVQIDLPKDIKATPNRVVLNIPVEQFTENVVKVPVTFENGLPDQSILPFPNKISVRYKVALSDYRDVGKKSFIAKVDLSNYPDSLSTVPHLEVLVESKNSNVLSYTFQPKEIEFLIEKKE